MKLKKMNDISRPDAGGVSLMTVLFLVFLTLKIVGVITWSWWWVTSPLWIPFAAVFGIGIFVLAFMTIAAISLAIIDR